jgi:hypothetical protein
MKVTNIQFENTSLSSTHQDLQMNKKSKTALSAALPLRPIHKQDVQLKKQMEE